MIAKTQSEIRILIAIGLMFAATAIASNFAQDRIPIHWNLQGEIDGYADKWIGLFSIPFVALSISLLFMILPIVDPGAANFESFSRTWVIIRLAIIGYLSIIQGAVIWASTGREVRMQVLMPLSMGLLFALLGNYMSKLRPELDGWRAHSVDAFQQTFMDEDTSPSRMVDDRHGSVYCISRCNPNGLDVDGRHRLLRLRVWLVDRLFLPCLAHGPTSDRARRHYSGRRHRYG